MSKFKNTFSPAERFHRRRRHSPFLVIRHRLHSRYRGKAENSFFHQSRAATRSLVPSEAARSDEKQQEDKILKVDLFIICIINFKLSKLKSSTRKMENVKNNNNFLKKKIWIVYLCKPSSLSHAPSSWFKFALGNLLETI